MSVMEIARITCQKDRGDEFVERLRQGLGVQARDANCSEIYFQRRVENPDEFFVHLVWTSVEDHDAWRAAHRDEWRSHIADLLEGLPSLLGHFTYVEHVKRPQA